MNLFDIILLAVALGIDCLVVSFSQGLIFTAGRMKNSLILALTMGIFQGVMPVFGYFGAGAVSAYVQNFAHWLVFVIFLILGLKFIIEAFQTKEETLCCIGIRCLISLGIATSIDALAAGVSINLTGTKLIIPALIIGIVSFVMSLGGFWFGNCFKKLPSQVLEIFGGMILIGLAVKAVV